MSDSKIDRTIGFTLGSVEETEIAFTRPLGEGIFSYARRENPTVSDCERSMAELEGAKFSVLAPSGMAAINIALSIFNDPDDKRPWIFPSDAYGGTAQFAHTVLHDQRGTNIRLAGAVGRASTTANLLSAVDDEGRTGDQVVSLAKPVDRAF